HLTCALTDQHTVRCWGNQSYPVVKEDGTPLGPVSLLALGPTAACATLPDGVYCWGQNDLGELARPLTVDESTRAVLSAPGIQQHLGVGYAAIVHDGDTRICAWGHNGTKEITSVDGVRVYTSPQCGVVNDVAQLVVGADHACVRHPAGTFACWGERY